VAQAKARFSEMLRRAGAGEEIVVTSHGRPVARIVPAEPTKPTGDVAVQRLLEARRSLAGAGITRDEITEWIREGRT
jgi:prevent-host-death family protein